MVAPDGFEPLTLKLEVSCSIQLSYGARIRNDIVANIGEGCGTRFVVPLPRLVW